MPDAQPAPMGGSLPRGYLLALNRSFRRTLEAENKSPRTVEAYTDAVRVLARYCEAHGYPLLARQLRREHIQDFIADQLDRWKPATAHNRYRSLHAFFKWAVAEGDLPASPMDTRICGSSSGSDPAGENTPGSGCGMPAMYTRCVTDGSPAAASWITSHPYDQPTATTGGRALAMMRRTSAASAVSPADTVRCDGRSGTTTWTSLSRKRSATHRQSAGLDHIP